MSRSFAFACADYGSAQLIETAILTFVNHQTLIATKASRICYSAQGDSVLEFGLRRAQGPDAAIYGARAAIIGGCNATSNVLTGQMFDIPVSGTHAHSWVQSFPDEVSAFRAYAHVFPDSALYCWSTPTIRYAAAFRTRSPCSRNSARRGTNQSASASTAAILRT